MQASNDDETTPGKARSRYEGKKLCFTCQHASNYLKSETVGYKMQREWIHRCNEEGSNNFRKLLDHYDGCDWWERKVSDVDWFEEEKKRSRRS